MYTCAYCNTTNNIVLVSGKAYCQDCVRYVDIEILSRYIENIIPTLEKQKVFFVWAFGDSVPKLSYLPRAYDKLSREGWNEKWKKFDIPQDEWVMDLAKVFVKQQVSE